MDFAIDTALRAKYSRRGLSDSFLEGTGSYISYRGRTESFIEHNVERADIWMSYYAGRCTGSLVQAAGGTAAMFFGAMDAISGGIGTAGSAALGQAPAAALTAALTVEGVLTTGAGAVVLVDVLRKQAVASVGMTQAVGRGLERKNEEAETKGNGIPVKEKTTASNGLDYQSNPKHTQGQSGNRPNAGIEPENSLDLFGDSVPSTSKPNQRYTYDANTDTLHRFYNDGNGTWHWSGSTNQGSNSIKGSQVPNDIKNIFDLPKKGW